MIQQPQPPKPAPSEQRTDTVERLLKQAEIFRLTRSLKSKLAQASLKTNKSPAKTPKSETQRRRAKTLDGASSAPIAADWSGETPPSQQSKRRSSIASVRSNASSSSQLSSVSYSSPRARIPRISSVNSIPEAADDNLSPIRGNYVSPTRGMHSSPHFNPDTPNDSTYPSAAAAAAAAAAGAADADHSSPTFSSYALSSSPFPHYASPSANRPLFHPPPTSQYSPRKPIQAHRRSNPPVGTESVKMPSLKVSPSNEDHKPKGNANDADVTFDEEPLPSEPQTPPARKRAPPKTPEQASSADGASLLLHFAHSPGRATPKTPDFNVNDYLHFQTPSPARGQLTPSRFGALNSALFPSANVPLPSMRPDEQSDL